MFIITEGVSGDASSLPDNNASGESVILMPKRYQVVVAATKTGGIGHKGSLPWKLPSELKHFKVLTSATFNPEKKNAVIMGRKTWESIPAKNRPLPGRLNVILTRSSTNKITSSESVMSCGSMESALELLGSFQFNNSIENVFVIGGGEILRNALIGPGCEAIHMTEIDGSFDCDTFIPTIDTCCFHLWYSSLPIVENGTKYLFKTYVRVRHTVTPQHTRFELSNFSFLPKTAFENHQEFQYLKLVQNIISDGVEKGDRTLTGTFSKFGCKMEFNLRNTFPLLTTKRVFWRGVLEELLWFISGSTNAKVLQEKGIHIWDGNASRDYLDSAGLKDREEGDLGPIYGFQWRHFGARYTDMHADYSGQGFDQLMDVINKIKNNPDDRRIILSAWNPSDLKLMALPPCHMFSQFYVSNGELSCQMYQRSADMGLGVPFNIASYSLLTCLIAHVCGLLPGSFIHVIGDAHVYRNHVLPLQEQLKKSPRPFPILKINPEKKDIDSFVPSDFELIGYNPHGKIEMKMAV